MSKHEHDFVLQSYVFPDDSGEYEKDKPYAVLMCSEYDCGERKTEVMKKADIEEVRRFNQLSPLAGAQDADDDEEEGGE